MADMTAPNPKYEIPNSSRKNKGVTMIDDIASRFLLTRQYEQAKNSYLRALEIVQNLTRLEEKQKTLGTAGIYHQLGRVAEELREFEEARENYEKALEICIEFNDQYSQEIVTESLRRLKEREG
jgi:tetratricopeptide (TPR) repeat protein